MNILTVYKGLYIFSTFSLIEAFPLQTSTLNVVSTITKNLGVRDIIPSSPYPKGYDASTCPLVGNILTYNGFQNVTNDNSGSKRSIAIKNSDEDHAGITLASRVPPDVSIVCAQIGRYSFAALLGI